MTKSNKYLIRHLLSKTDAVIANALRVWINFSGGRLLRIPGDEIFEAIQHDSLFEQAERNFVHKFLIQGHIFWDAGANFGLYTLIGARQVKRKGKVLAIEPDPRNRRRLWINILLNAFTNVKVLPAALGDHEKEAEFLSCSEGAYSGLRVAKVPGVLKQIKVRQTTLDSVAAKFGWPQVDLLKMDVEGAEILVLQGGVEFFEIRPRPLVMCEFSDRRTIAFNYRAKEIYDWLADKGYLWFEFTENGKLKMAKPKEEYDYDNLVACPEEKLYTVDTWRQD